MKQLLFSTLRFRAERRAAPKPAHLGVCMPVNPACIAAPAGGRPAYPLGGGST